MHKKLKNYGTNYDFSYFTLNISLRGLHSRDLFKLGIAYSHKG